MILETEGVKVRETVRVIRGHVPLGKFMNS